MKQLGIPIKGTSIIYIGLDLISAVSLFEDEDIIEKDDMGNGYIWLKCWIYPFDQRILCRICFKDGFAVEIELFPYVNCITGNESWDEASEEKMIFDKEFCERWLADHNVAFLEKATVVTDKRNLSAGIMLR